MIGLHSMERAIDVDESGSALQNSYADVLIYFSRVLEKTGRKRKYEINFVY
jgi:hypothetical protein